ncbi:MAG: hypothetical protein WCX65_15910 [bacterium]
MARKKVLKGVILACIGVVAILAVITAADYFRGKPAAPDSLIECNPALYVSVSQIKRNKLTMALHEPYRKILKGKAARETGLYFFQAMGVSEPEKMSGCKRRFLSKMVLGDGFSAAIFTDNQEFQDFVIVSPASLTRRAAFKITTFLPPVGRHIATLEEGGRKYRYFRAGGARKVYFAVKKKCFIASSNIDHFKATLSFADGESIGTESLSELKFYKKIKNASKGNGALFFAYVSDKENFALGKSVNAYGLSLRIKKKTVEVAMAGNKIHDAVEKSRAPFSAAHFFPADADLVWETGNFGEAWNNLFLEAQTTEDRLTTFFKNNFGIDYSKDFSKYFRGDISAFVKNVSIVTDGTPVPNTTIAIGATDGAKALAAFDSMITGSISGQFEKQTSDIYGTKVIWFKNKNEKAALSPAYTMFDDVIYFSLRREDIKKILNVKNGFVASLFDVAEFKRYVGTVPKNTLLNIYAPGVKLSPLARDYLVGVVKVSQGFFTEEIQKVFLPGAENLASAEEFTGATRIDGEFVITEMKIKWKKHFLK